MNLFLFSVFVIFSSSISWSGGWVSSGGELFRDGKNPWFVRNTTEVKYCIQIDSASVSASRAEIESAFQDGISYWKNEFGRTADPQPRHFTVATQNFVMVDCKNDPDLKIQFGYGTLDTEQLQKLVSPKKYVGVTVRTDYDSVALKAKGFIYFSSDMGQYAYDDDEGTLIPKAWSRKKILNYAMLHELGHVFGLPHMGTGLMSEVFLNQILNKQLVEKYEQSPVDSFIQVNQKVKTCSGFDRKALSWFGAPSTTTCLLISTSLFGNWQVSASDTDGGPEKAIGEFRQVSLNIADLRAKPSIFLQLTKEQGVFTTDETEFRNFLMGPLMIDTSLTAVYFLKDSAKPQTATINMSPQSLSIQGVMQNKIELLLSYNSPLSLLLLMSPKP